MNIHAPHPSRSQDYRFTDDDFRIIADFAKSRFGLDLQTSKKPLVYSRLAKRLRALGLNDFSQYCSNLLDEANATEISHLLSALTTNVTHFFREKHHFDYLADVVTPQIFEKAKSGESIRLWSAASRSLLYCGNSSESQAGNRPSEPADTGNRHRPQDDRSCEGWTLRQRSEVRNSDKDAIIDAYQGSAWGRASNCPTPTRSHLIRGAKPDRFLAHAQKLRCHLLPQCRDLL